MPGGRLRSSRTQTTVVATTASALPRRCGDPTSSHQRCRLTVPRTGSARSATSPTGTGGASSWPVSTIITVGSRSAGTRSSVPGRPAPCARVGSRPDSRSAARSCRHRLRRDDRVPAQRRGVHVVPAPSPEDAGADNCPARSADAFFGPAGAVVDCGPVVHIGPERPSQAQVRPKPDPSRASALMTVASSDVSKPSDVVGEDPVETSSRIRRPGAPQLPGPQLMAEPIAVELPDHSNPGPRCQRIRTIRPTS